MSKSKKLTAEKVAYGAGYTVIVAGIAAIVTACVHTYKKDKYPLLPRRK
jgi:hypothetical protein